MLHRGYRWIRQHAEKRLVATGWQPRPKLPIGHKNSLFHEIDGWQDVWRQYFSLNHKKLNELRIGKIDLFSHESLFIGRPVDWHRDPLTGKKSSIVFGKTLDYRETTQLGDVKVLWELGRQQHLISLAAAYACSGNTEYRDAVVSQIEGWIDANPFGMGVHWCSALEVGLRLISWAVVHSLLTLRDHQLGLFSVVCEPDKFGLAIYQQAWFIRYYLSRYSSANNHLIGELTGLWVTSQVFDLGAKGEQWGKFAQKELEEQALDQIYSDGVNKEQAIYYHLWVLEYLLFAWLVGGRCNQPFSQVFRERVLLMSEFLHDISPKNGEPPQIGDADDGFVTRFEPNWPSHPYHDVQRAISIVFRNRYGVFKEKPSQKAFWYGLIAGLLPGDVANTELDAEKSYPILYKDGGLAILGEEHLRIVFDAGSLGYPSIAAHGHADALSFCLALDGEWWLVDPGTYAYQGGAEWRDYFRGTSAHNTVVINGKNQSRIGGAFLWLERAHSHFEAFGKKSDGTQYVRGVHDGYAAIGSIHHREIRYLGANNTVEIIDIIENKKHSRSLQAFIYFHFAPDMEITLEDSRCLVTKPGSKQKLRMDLDQEYKWVVVKGQIDPIQGWYSPNIGLKVPAAVLVGTHRRALPAHTTTRIKVIAGTSKD